MEDYKYLWAWISSFKKDFTTRRARAWDIAHKLKPLWSLDLQGAKTHKGWCPYGGGGVGVAVW